MSTETTTEPAVRRVLPAVGLFFLAPLVAEFLLGNIPINMIFMLPVLAALYGGGALLIREIARRTGRGWPTIVVFALAYGVLEEGFTTQTLFNPNFLGLDLLQPAYIPVLGMGGWWTVFVLTLHTVWSISVPIAVVETLARSRRTTPSSTHPPRPSGPPPWLGRIGLAVTSVLFVAATAILTAFSVQTYDFVASGPQLVGAGVAVVVLVVVAMLLGRRRTQSAPTSDRATPSPWAVGIVSLAAGSVFMAMNVWGNQLPWLTVGVELALFAVVIALVRHWSHRTGWGDAHRLALAGGALLTYAWHAFVQDPSMSASVAVDLVGNAVFAAGAVVLIVVAARGLRKPHEALPEPAA